MLDWTTILAVGLLPSAGTVSAAVIAARASRSARAAHRVGEANRETLEQIREQTDPRQEALIERTVQQVAKRNPELLEHALADHFVREVLEAILEGRRRDGD